MGSMIFDAVMWKPEGDVCAILQISHGMTEYVNRYEELAEYLTARGILVVGNDHLGHGQSVIREEEWGFFASGDAGAKGSARSPYIDVEGSQRVP